MWIASTHSSASPGTPCSTTTPERTFQFDRGGQFVKGKSATSFAPLGPVLVTRDEMPDTGNLGIWLTVNGTMRQKSTHCQLDGRRARAGELRQRVHDARPRRCPEHGHALQAWGSG